MATCSLCGSWAGLFRREHESCAIDAEKRIERSIIHERAVREGWVARLKAEIVADLGTERISASLERCREQLGQSQTTSVAGQVASELINNGVLVSHSFNLKELDCIASFIEAAGVNGRDIPDRGWARLAMLATLADLALARLPDRVEDPGLGFTYEAGERAVWVFGGARHLETKTQRIGGNRPYVGISLRVVSGLYVHQGLPRNEPSLVEGLVATSEGNLVITDRALWYQGPHRTLRVKLKEIGSLQCFDDGFGFCKLNATARNQVFITHPHEGWFAHDLVRRLYDRSNR